MNKNFLKVVAFLSMIIDHIGAALFPSLIFLRLIGRIAYPIFAFSVAEGYFFTKNKKKYLFRLFIFAFISIVPFSLFCKGTLFYFEHWNVMFTLFFGALCIYISEYDKTCAIIFIFFISCTAELFKFDFGAVGVLYVFFMYKIGIISKNKNKQSAVHLIFCLILSFYCKKNYLLSILVNIILIYIYDPKKEFNKKISKIFYFIYPVHLLIIFFVKKYFFL